MEQYVILEKAERGHKQYARTVRGKLQQIKQKGTVKPEEKGKKKEKKSEETKKEKKPEATSGIKAGHVILVGRGHEAKVTAVGKDGVTAKDDKGNKYLILNDNVQKKGGKKSEVDKEGKEKLAEGKTGETKESDSYKDLDSEITKLEEKYKMLKQSGKIGSKVLSDIKSVIDQWKAESSKKEGKEKESTEKSNAADEVKKK